MGFGAGDVNFLAYVGNDPINQNDPSGNYAEVVVDGNNVNITIPIRYSGFAMTDKNVAAFNRGIKNAWSGPAIGNYNVTTTVKQLSFFESLFTSNAKQNFIEIKPASVIGGRSSTGCVAGGGCNGEWRGNGDDLSGMAAHETGHILRLDDQYRPNGGAQPGFMGNLMGPLVGPKQKFGDVWPQDIQQVIQNSQNGWQRVPQGPHEPTSAGSLPYPSTSNTSMQQSVYRK